MDPKPPIAAVPIRSVAPTTQPAESTDFETKPPKVKKKKSTAKRSNQFAPRVWEKQLKKKPSASRKTKTQFEAGIKVERKNLNVGSNESKWDFSTVPPPYCSCTGDARVCYKCGGGWQSSCCTINISEYPLPKSPTKPGARVSGRKMTSGAYGNLLHRLASEGRDLSHPVDLKDHWARLGTNNFVTIK
ncbi:basic pentacysteine 7 [Actinidia rufa]|uniref:GAGA-binding transcriptional activator n=1 Tax=Actinidia rufa TaxID=165716 RepID=A0A7J0H0P9_9ERIC|nr:basic pentacysteine 7 [Actinidia rufa]